MQTPTSTDTDTDTGKHPYEHTSMRPSFMIKRTKRMGMCSRQDDIANSKNAASINKDLDHWQHTHTHTMRGKHEKVLKFKENTSAKGTQGEKNNIHLSIRCKQRDNGITFSHQTEAEAELMAQRDREMY